MTQNPEDDDVLDRAKQSRHGDLIQKNHENNTTQIDQETEPDRTTREGIRLLDVLQRNSTLPIAVSTVQVFGAVQTRPSFLKVVTSPLHSPSTSGPQPLASIIQTTNSVVNTLMSFNIFDPTKMQISFDRARSHLAGENDVDITFHLHEKPRFAATTGTWAGDGEATAQMSARAENLFGGAERIEGVLEAGTRTRSAWEVKFQSPIAARADILGEVAVFGNTRDYKFFASHELSQRGAHAKIKALSNIGVHEFTLSTILRQVSSLSQTASPSILTSAGETIKNAFSHSIVHDKRDDTLLPTNGYLLKSTQEYAGLGGGDVKYLKAMAETQYVKTFQTLWPRTHFVYGARGGILWSLERSMTTRITDRFFVGGPTDVRGFREFGIGPKDGNDSVGGEAFMSYSASMMFPIPNAPATWPLRLHAFLNAGALLPLNQANVGSTFSELFRYQSVGIGLGVLYRTPIGRVELNFGVPITIRQGDWARKGLQFGIGIDFM